MRTINLGLIGLGTVGTGVVKLLLSERERLRHLCDAELVLKRIVVRDRNKPRAVIPAGVELSDDVGTIINDPDIEIGIELMGTVEPAFELISRLLRAGKHVVTANKAVLAEHGRELFAIADQNERAICFEASVAGGIPIIRAVGQSLVANRIQMISGILNGTSNYILTEMHQERRSYQTALAQAQAHGFAEADPRLDVNGTDSAQKLAILSRLAFQSRISPGQVPCQGIDRLADTDIRFALELGYVIKLLAVARAVDDRLYLRVAPTLVHHLRSLGQVPGENNAVEVVGSAVGATFFEGKGAGMLPTASSVVADLVDLVLGKAQATFRSQRLWDEDPPGPKFVAGTYMPSRFYLRYTITDKPGTLAQIAGILGAHGISISSVVQPETSEDAVAQPVALIVMTHLADEAAVRAALEKTDRLDIVREPTVCLHVIE